MMDGANTNDYQRERLELAHSNAAEPAFLPNAESIGLGKFKLNPEHAEALEKLHKAITEKVSDGVTWGEGGDADPRRRMYAFMPGKLQELTSAGIRIQKEGATDDKEHHETLKTACVNLSFSEDDETAPASGNNSDLPTIVVDEATKKALLALTYQVQALVRKEYKQFVTLKDLLCVQPNLHNGASILPAHLDFPRHDGFGVIIVTFAAQGSGTIVLIDEGDEGVEESRSWSFELDKGECYILSGDARNKCHHGVLCNGDISNRETLNLRYGFHSNAFAWDEVLQHWPDAEEA